MKVWNKETRNKEGKFYRGEGWAVEVPKDFSKPNFTTTEPPEGECDWVDGAWVATPPSELEVVEKALKDSDGTMPRYVEDLYDTLIANEVLTIAQLPPLASDRLANKKYLRKAIRTARGIV